MTENKTIKNLSKESTDNQKTFVEMSNGYESKKSYVKTNEEGYWAGCNCCKTDGSVNIEEKDTGKVIWSQKDYDFLDADYGDSVKFVHPSLWTNGKNNHINGLFEVLKEKIYQVRGYDMANITFVRTKSGWLVMDTLMSKECTYAALQLADEYFLTLGDSFKLLNHIKGIMVSHSHIDHFGGINAVIYYNRGIKSVQEEVSVVDLSELRQGITVIAPENFVEHCVSENVYAGNAMARRASYQYGTFIGAGAKGSVAIGIGLGQSLGTTSFATPDITIDEKIAKMSRNMDAAIDENTESRKSILIDGLRVCYQLTPGTEAPTEMNCYFPSLKALWMAENCNCTLHNLYTLRGAQVRDGNAWSKYIVEAEQLFCGKDESGADMTEVIFQSHNWPHWSAKLASEYKNDREPKETLNEFMLNTASIYKYINDQTLLFMNEGYKMDEVARKINIPANLGDKQYLRPYYGTPTHDAKAVYQKYLGWYDANPVNLNKMPTKEYATKMVEYLSSAEDIMEKLSKDYECGNYQFVAEMTNMLVFADSTDETVKKSAIKLCADSLEQLAYMTESGTWRNAYLSAAYELQNGKARVSTTTSVDLMSNMTGSMILDYIGILFDCDRKIYYQDEFRIKIDQEVFYINVKNGTILYTQLETQSDVDVVKYDFAVTGTSMVGLLNYAIDSYDDSLKEKIGKILIEGKSDTAIQSLYEILDNLTNLSYDQYKFFDIVMSKDKDVQVIKNTTVVKKNGKEVKETEVELIDIAEKVKDCIHVFEINHYADMQRCANDKLTEYPDIMELWKNHTSENTTVSGYYDKLVVQTAVIEDGRFFVQIPESGSCSNNDGIGWDAKFRKYEYVHILYEFYKYLSKQYKESSYEPVIKKEGKDDSYDVFYLKKALQLIEPYILKFRQRDKGVYNTEILKFEDTDMDLWKEEIKPHLNKMILSAEYYSTTTGTCDIISLNGDFFGDCRSNPNLGVGIDGNFYGREIVHLGYLLYKKLYQLYTG